MFSILSAFDICHLDLGEENVLYDFETDTNDGSNGGGRGVQVRRKVEQEII